MPRKTETVTVPRAALCSIMAQCAASHAPYGEFVSDFEEWSKSALEGGAVGNPCDAYNEIAAILRGPKKAGKGKGK